MQTVSTVQLIAKLSSETASSVAASQASATVQMMPPHCDYRALPLDQEVALFRRIGMQTLMALLREKRLPDLPTMLTKTYVQANRPQLFPTTWLRRYLVYGQQAFWDDLGLSLGESFRHLRTRRWRAAYQAMQQLPPRIGLTTRFNRLERTLGTGSAEAIPADLVALVAVAAWGDLTFQHELATKLRTYLRQSVLFTQRDKALVLLSPNTFWILLALTPIPTVFSFAWLTRDYWLARWAARHLQQAATQHGLAAAGWAGFWDQWVIWNAMTHTPDAVVRLDPALYNAITALPIFQWTVPPAYQQSPTEADAMADKVAQTANKSVTAGQGGAPTLTFAAPDWAATMPGWFHGQYVHPTAA